MPKYNRTPDILFIGAHVSVLLYFGLLDSLNY